MTKDILRLFQIKVKLRKLKEKLFF